jgi:hypothetical protein
MANDRRHGSIAATGNHQRAWGTRVGNVDLEIPKAQERLILAGLPGAAPIDSQCSPRDRARSSPLGDELPNTGQYSFAHAELMETLL